MRICDYYSVNKDMRLVVGMGYFDSVHKGHAYLIGKVKEMADKLDATPCIFTFSNNPFEMFGKTDKNIFSFEERCLRLEHLGIEMLITVSADRDFVSMDAEKFLDIMTHNYNIVGFVSGTDYTYGAKASGSADTLKEYGLRHNISVNVVDLLKDCGKKIASRDLRRMLDNGDLDKVNELLSEPYSISGVVKAGRKDGTKIGIPTANIDLVKDTLIIKNGVYSTMVIIDNKRYRAVTNVGAHPTFDDNRKNIEAYILDFDDNIYGKEIRVVFYRWLRGVKKFESIKELQDTIYNDELTTRREVVL